MSVFVDTGVFYAHHDTDASRHTVGADALTTVLSSAEHGQVMTSDYVYSGSEANAHPFTGADEADNMESTHVRRSIRTFHAAHNFY